LGAFTAIEEQPVPAPPNERGGETTPGGRRRAGGAEEENVEIHGPILADPCVDLPSGNSPARVVRGLDRVGRALRAPRVCLALAER
jgi:hypothetical protein